MTLILVLIAISALGYFLFLRPRDVQVEPSSEGHVSDRTLSLYGDSISAASDLGKQLPQVKITNYAIAGSALSDIAKADNSDYFNLKQLPQQLALDTSAVVMSRYGMNDCLRGNNLDAFKNDLREFVMLARLNGKLPILGGLTHATLDLKNLKNRAKFNSAIAEVASELKAHFIDINQVNFNGAEDLIDGLHPNPEYSARVDQFIAQEIALRNIFA